MTDTELQALTALVQHEAAMFNCQCAQYGQQMHDHDREVHQAIRDELRQRGVLPFPSPESEKEPRS